MCDRVMGVTHSAIGAVTGLAVTEGYPVWIRLAAAAVGAIVARLPDTLEAGIIPHRTATHSLVIPAALTVLYPALWGYVCAAAYASHIVADSFTVSGVRALWPLPVNVRLGAIVTGRFEDYLVGVAFTFALMGWIILGIGFGMTWGDVVALIADMRNNPTCPRCL
jgi:membrane-bound metal-dependent hydrolase YbcI (DUF457 family)